MTATRQGAPVSELSKGEREDRRSTLINMGAIVMTSLAGLPASSKALDMDAFAAGELAADKKSCNPKLDPKCVQELSKDEALCQVR